MIEFWTKTETPTMETELSCRECGLVAVEIYEIEGIQDGRGYISCYECGEPAEVEIE